MDCARGGRTRGCPRDRRHCCRRGPAPRRRLVHGDAARLGSGRGAPVHRSEPRQRAGVCRRVRPRRGGWPTTEPTPRRSTTQPGHRSRRRRTGRSSSRSRARRPVRSSTAARSSWSRTERRWCRRSSSSPPRAARSRAGLRAPAQTVTGFDGSKWGAVYKGLATAGDWLYATDFVNARVDIIDGDWKLVKKPGAFHDPKLPKGYAPFGIQNARRRTSSSPTRSRTKGSDDEIAGPGLGFVDEYSTDGTLLHRVAKRRQAERSVGPRLGARHGLRQGLRRAARRQLRRRLHQHVPAEPQGPLEVVAGGC